MKNTLKHIATFAILILLSACSNDQDEVVADFLDGTQYGVLLDVIVKSPKSVSKADLDNYSLNFEVQIKGNERPIESLLVSKTFIDGENGESTTVSLESLTQFPHTFNLSMTDLVEGFSDLSVDDLNTTDSFKIHFTIKYSDGLVVDRFDPSMRTNFTILITP